MVKKKKRDYSGKKTIVVSDQTHDLLNEMKVHPKMSMDQIITLVLQGKRQELMSLKTEMSNLIKDAVRRMRSYNLINLTRQEVALI